MSRGFQPEVSLYEAYPASGLVRSANIPMQYPPNRGPDAPTSAYPTTCTMIETSPKTPNPPVTPCEGCNHPRDTEDCRLFVGAYVRSLRRYRDEGCPTCSLILQGLEGCLGEAVVTESDYLHFVFNGLGVWDFHVIVGSRREDTVSFFVSPGKAGSEVNKAYAAVKSWPVGYDVPGTTSSTESLDWAKAQLSECLSSHPACASNPTTTLPDRILDVGTSPDARIRLQETDGSPGRYICLSHC